MVIRANSVFRPPESTTNSTLPGPGSLQFHTPFLFFCCQHGAENAIKSSLCAPNGPFRLSFSQPGFVTLKGTMSISPWSRALPISPWIRCSGHAFSSVAGDDAIPLVARVVEEHRSLDWEFLHIWERDPALPGWNGLNQAPPLGGVPRG